MKEPTVQIDVGWNNGSSRNGYPVAKLVRYADDILVMAKSKKGIEAMMQIIADNFSNFSL